MMRSETLEPDLLDLAARLRAAYATCTNGTAGSVSGPSEIHDMAHRQSCIDQAVGSIGGLVRAVESTPDSSAIM